MKETILDFSADEARAFFLEPRNYFTLDLPSYFDFHNVLKQAKSDLSSFGDNINQLHTNLIPNNSDKVNYPIICNKDGKLAWRKLQIIHPYLYVDLVNTITEAPNWTYIVNTLKNKYQNDKVICTSMIPLPNSSQRVSEASIVKWSNTFSREMVNLSMEYSCVAATDISDCYGSIYTHSVAWALAPGGMNYAKNHKYDKQLFNIVDSKLMALNYGQTNGIPQGSTLMDFIAEIVLCYVDRELERAIGKLKCEYTILRYRDDYRVFANNEADLISILKTMTEILLTFNFRLNVHKTSIAKNAVLSSKKPDKVYWEKHKSIIINSDSDFSIERSLFLIDEMGALYPNCGSLDTSLSLLYKRIVDENIYPLNANQIVATTIDIMYNNPRTYKYCVAILSKYFDLCPDDNTVSNWIEQIVKKFESISNTEYLELWLQRLCITDNRKYNYKSKICQLVDEQSVNIWDSSWLRLPLNDADIVNFDEIKNITRIIPAEEVLLFNNYNESW